MSNLKPVYSLKRYGKFIFPLCLLSFLLILASHQINANFSNIFNGLGLGVKFFSKMFPPDWSVLEELLKPALDTILMAFLGTVMGTFLSIPFAVAAASNISPFWLRNLTRFLISLERALPEIIILLFLVAAVGLGVIPGVISLSIGAIGMLGKFLADAIEEIDSTSLDSIRSVGATRAQIIYYGVIPQIVPKIISYSLFRFELNVRLSVVIGAVGAGGIGYYLNYYFGLNEYRKALTALLFTTFLVVLSERISFYLRNQINEGDQLK